MGSSPAVYIPEIESLFLILLLTASPEKEMDPSTLNPPLSSFFLVNQGNRHDRGVPAKVPTTRESNALFGPARRSRRHDERAA